MADVVNGRRIKFLVVICIPEFRKQAVCRRLRAHGNVGQLFTAVSHRLDLQVFTRQERLQRFCGGEAAEAGVKYADGSLIHAALPLNNTNQGIIC